MTRRVRIAEVDVDASVDADARVLGHRLVLITGQGAAQFLGQGFDHEDHFLGDDVGGAVLGQMQQADEYAGALHQGANLGVRVFSDDQIAFAVRGHGKVIGLGWALSDVDHASNRAAGLGGAGAFSGLERHEWGAQTGGQLAAQLTASLHVEAVVEVLVDGLVSHKHIREIGIEIGKREGDMLGTVLIAQQIVEDVEQLGIEV